MNGYYSDPIGYSTVTIVIGIQNLAVLIGYNIRQVALRRTCLLRNQEDIVEEEKMSNVVRSSQYPGIAHKHSTRIHVHVHVDISQ